MIITHFNLILNLGSQWVFVHTKKMEIKPLHWDCKSKKNISMQKYLSVYIYVSIQLPYVKCIVEYKAVVYGLLI